MSVLAAWINWKERCALDLCSAEDQGVLRNFAHVRFVRFAGQYGHATNIKQTAPLVPSTHEAWHLFETYARIRQNRAGKCYKQWLFARLSADAEPLPGLEAGATLIMRDAYRDYLRREFSQSWACSLDQPVPVSGDLSVTLNDLLPSDENVRDHVEQRELEKLAEEATDPFFETLKVRERVALLARELGLSLAHPEAAHLAGCGKSVLNTAYHEVLQRLALQIREAHADEDVQTQNKLACMVFERVRARIITWGFSEKACARLFIVSKKASANEAGAGAS